MRTETQIGSTTPRVGRFERLIRPEFPALWAAVSMWVATPLIMILGVLYVSRGWIKPTGDVYGMGMAVFGVTAALSGICFTVPQSAESSPEIHFAGEKFLHSALLFVQSLMVFYIKQTVSAWPWVHSHQTLAIIIDVNLATVLTFVSGGAVRCWYLGFKAVNCCLWKNWEHRVAQLREAQNCSPLPANATQSQPALPPANQTSKPVSVP